MSVISGMMAQNKVNILMTDLKNTVLNDSIDGLNLYIGQHMGKNGQSINFRVSTSIRMSP